KAGPRSPHVAEPFHPPHYVPQLVEMVDADRVDAVTRAQADSGVRVPTHVRLDDLHEAIGPVLLDAQLHDGIEIARQPRGREDGIRPGIDRPRQPRAFFFLYPVVDLPDVADRVVAAFFEERVRAERDSVPDIELIVDDYLREGAGERAVLRV